MQGHDLNSKGTRPPVASPGPRTMNMANEFRSGGILLRRASAGATERAAFRRRGRGQRLNGDLGHEFAAAAGEIAAEYHRRLSGVRGLTRHQRAGAVRAIKEWRAAALTALRRDYAAKRAAAKCRALNNRPLTTPPPRPRRASRHYRSYAHRRS